MDDQDRLRAEYADRKKRLANRDVYSFFNPAYLFSRVQLERVVLKILRKRSEGDLSNKSILEVGCGNGGVLLDFLRYEGLPEKIFGVDLLFDRLPKAKNRLPLSLIANADGQNLPFSAHTMDIVLQYTVFSSILDGSIKANIAKDMLRVLKPGGLIFWYDFWLNPTNKQTRGIRPAEIRSLFPNCAFEWHKVTLAPPLARKVVPISWGFALFLETLGLFNTHYLVVIRPL